MKWDKINFGNNKKVQNKTLPQVIFIDPDWFFFQYERENSYLKKQFGSQADYVYQRARRIKPKQDHYIKHFLFCDYTSDGFSSITIEKAESKFSDCIETGNYCEDIELFDSQQFMILKRIDLRFPKSLKDYLNIKRITEQKAIEFFENDDNFILDYIR